MLRFPAICLSTAALLSFAVRANGQDAPAAPAASPRALPTHIVSDVETRVTKALKEVGKFSFIDQPLRDVAAQLSRSLKIAIVIDRRALDEYGIDVDTPITKQVSGISHGSFMSQFLSDVDLTYEVRNGSLWITTLESAEAMLPSRVYPVGDLVIPVGGGEADYDSLSDAIQTVIAPDSWESVGGPAAITGVYGALVVSQTTRVHDDIGTFLRAYRELAATDANQAGIGSSQLLLGPKGNTEVHKRLDHSVTLDFIETPLHDVLQHLSREANVPAIIDTRSLEDVGGGRDVPVTIAARNVVLRNALDQILHELDLAYIVRDELLVITTRETAESTLVYGLYPVQDLLDLREQSHVVGMGGGSGEVPTLDISEYDFDSLIKTITTIVQPESWADVGGPGAMTPIGPKPTLFIAQTNDVHHQINSLLADLRKAKAVERNRAAQTPIDPNARPVKRLVLKAYHLIGHPAEDVDTVLRRAMGDAFDIDADVFVQVVGRSLVVRHDVPTHRKIHALLIEIGAILPKGHGGPGQPPAQQPGGTF